jgi:hypothetical protein
MNIAIQNPGMLVDEAGRAADFPQWPRDAHCFRTAMLAEVTVSPYGEPDMILSRYRSWLIVQRRGAGGSILTVGFAGGDNVNGRKAPLRLRAITTRHARMFDHSANASEFLFHRWLPDQEAIEGVFEPCEGYARVENTSRGLRLTAFGRIANQARRRGGAAVLAEIDAPSDQDGVSWRICANRKPWTGEIIGG